jgi:hypothetical protein
MYQTIFLCFFGLIANDIKNLDSNKFLVRERATSNLIRWGVVARPQLEDVAKNGSAEASRRAAMILEYPIEAAMQARMAEIRRRFGVDYDKLPWIDMLQYNETPRVHTIYLDIARLYGAPTDGPPKWTDYRAATYFWLMDMANSDMKIDDLTETIKKMHERGADYLKRNPPNQPKTPEPIPAPEPVVIKNT